VGPSAPSIVHAFIEITPFDLVKFEVDKASGYMKVDRAQRTSSLPPALYGFVPRTYSGDRVTKLMPGSTGGDHDPIDICVITERPIQRAEFVIQARVVGGLPMIDGGEADDKLIAVMAGDPLYDHIEDIDRLPSVLKDRLAHYFSTYKLAPDGTSKVVVGEPYGREHAHAVIRAGMEDYLEHYPDSVRK
jgi:inorganic pyrophosphatase